MVFRELSVEENLLLGAFPKARRAAATQRLAQAYGLFPRLAERRRQLAGSLSGGEAQMLGLMSDPELLLIDEPSLGLAPVIVQELFERLRAIKGQGKTIVLVEQNTALALEISDQVYLLSSGRIVLSEDAAKIDLAALHDLYFSR